MPIGVAQEPESDSTQAQIEAARAKLAALDTTDLAEDGAWRTALGARVELLLELQSTNQEQTELQDSPSAAELAAELADLQTRNDELLAVEMTQGSDLESLDQLSSFETTLSTASSAAAEALQREDEASSRRRSAREELTRLPVRAAELRKLRSELTEDDELTRYRSKSAQIEDQIIAARTAFLGSLVERLDLLEPQRALQISISRREVELATNNLANARTRAAELREEQERVARENAAEEARRAQLANDPVLRFRLRIRSEVATLKADDASQGTRTEQLKARIDDEKAQAASQERDRNALEERLRIRPEGAEAHLLRNRKRIVHELQAIDELELPVLLDQAELVQEQLVRVLDRRWTLRLDEDENLTLRDFLAEMGAERRAEAIEIFPDLLREEGLLDALAERQRGLERTDSRYSEITKLMTSRKEALLDLQSYISSQMMWSHSEPMVTSRTFAAAWEDLKKVGAILTGEKLSRRITDTARSLGAFFALLMLGLVVLHFWLRRLRAKDDDRADLGPSMSIRMWIRVLIYAAIPSIGIWILLGAFELNSGQLHENYPLWNFVNLQAILILTRRLSRALLGPKGLAIGKWGAVPEVGVQWNRCIRQGTWAGQLFYAPMMMTSLAPFSAVALPRLLWLPLTAVLGLAILRLFRRKGAVVQTWTAPNSLSRLVVQGIGALGALTLIPLLVVDFLGYRIGAEQSALNGLRIFQALFVLMGIYRVLDRTGDALVMRILRGKGRDEEDEEHQATRKAGKALTQMASTLLICAAAVFFQQRWGIGEPTQRLLLSLELIKLDSGAFITGWDIFLGLSWIVGGHILVHNLSRLHDRVLVPFIGSGEIGARYAVLTLIRYAILCLAYFLGLRSFGLDMGTLGWLMTGASVGLGFGLQEVVANFISGLILLFEQPIRVGDIITVGTTGGKIDKITIRATVVTNWERQTIIIPNKTFITQNLINWTRHDQVMRRTLQVRIAYGSDMEKVLQIVDRILVDHHSVLEDPPHRIWVQKLGDFGIELDIWFFAAIGDGLSTRSDISAAVLSRFKAEGIEIPVVTRDLQVKD